VPRKTVYNKNLTNPETWDKVCFENKELLEDFLIYKRAGDKSLETIKQYQAMLKIFFVWNVDHNQNIPFVKMRKKNLIKFLFYMTNDLKYSPNRISTMKSVLSSLGNYIEAVMSDDYPNYRNQVRGLESPARVAVREKTILTKELIDKTFSSLIESKLYQVALYLAISLASGARKSEVLRFRVDSFEEKNKIFNGCMWKTSHIKTKGRGSSGKSLQKFVFVDQVEPYLKLWMEERIEKNIQSEWLFLSENDKASINNANTWSSIISKHMGVEFYIHACRHYWTTMLKQHNLPDEVVVALTGWEKGSGTAMVAIYNDTKIEETLAGYFDENGIKNNIGGQNGKNLFN
jgi:integrase